MSLTQPWGNQPAVTHQQVRIVTCDPNAVDGPRIEGVLKDGAIIQVAIWDTPLVFRWPVEGETWRVCQRAQYWYLDELVDDPNDENPIEALEPGEAKIAAEKVFDRNSRRLVAIDPATASDGESPILVDGEWEAQTLTGGNSGHTIQDEGVDQPERSKLDFVGGGVTVTDGPGDKTTVSVPTVEAWHVVGAGGEPAFTNSWGNYSGSWPSAQFYKDPSGVVHLRGLINGGTSGSTVFILPAGYRPSVQEMFAAIYSTAGTPIAGRIDVTAAGNVVATQGSTGGTPGSGGNAFTNLSGISFRAN